MIVLWESSLVDNGDEMKMLSRSQGLTLLDRVKNEEMQHKMGVTIIDSSFEQKRLTLAIFGHVRKRPDDHIKNDLSSTSPNTW